MIFPLDTIQQQDSIPFFLKAEELLLFPDSVTTDGFGAFEHLPTTSSGALFDYDAIISAEIATIGKEGLFPTFPPLAESLFFLVFLSLFLLFSLVFQKEGFGLIANVKGYFLPRNKNATIYSDQVTSAKARSDAFFVLQAAVVISVTAFIFLLKENWWQFSFEKNVLVFVGIFIIILTFFGLKYLVYKIIGIFFLRDDMNDWIEHYFGVVKMIGVLLFIPAILYIYFGELRGIIYISTIIIFFISRVVIAIRLLNIFVKNEIGLFYFFVYLCGTEIAPYILYFKGVLLLTNIVGNVIL